MISKDNIIPKKMSKKRIMYRWLKIFVLILIAFEVYNIVSDIYNFKQFWKAKEILDTMPEDSRKFYHLDEFNSQYNADIQPIRNCYYVSNDNGEEKYIFAFKNYSLIFRVIHWDIYIYIPNIACELDLFVFEKKAVITRI